MVAIIGAGVSGLITAYLLKKQGIKSIIFEKLHRAGGNAHTMDVHIPGFDKQRWADMGVNDFNLTTYTNIKTLFKETGIIKYCKSLENSTTFYTPDGSMSYVINKDGHRDMPEHLWRQYQHFSTYAPKDVFGNIKKYGRYTVGDYIAEKEEYTEAFAQYNLYPRINSMYYMNDETPARMPIVAVLHYYKLQEGFGDKKKHPHRVYIEGGISRWIEAFVEYLNPRIIYDADVEVKASEQGPVVIHDNERRSFDAVFLSTHANTCFNVVTEGLSSDQVNLLSSFRYFDSISVAHTYTPVMPVDSTKRSTYNILIHEDYAQLRPYTISYVCNRHQNDAANPEYNKFDTPHYYVSLNPYRRIPKSNILQQYDGSSAIAYMSHNTLDFRSMEQQKKIHFLQGENGLYFSGGWTVGAGLHEECYQAAQAAVKKYLSGQHSEDLFYDFDTGLAPKYLVEK